MKNYFPENDDEKGENKLEMKLIAYKFAWPRGS